MESDKNDAYSSAGLLAGNLPDRILHVLDGAQRLRRPALLWRFPYDLRRHLAGTIFIHKAEARRHQPQNERKEFLM